MSDRPILLEKDNIYIDKENKQIVIQPHDSLNDVEIRINIDQIWPTILEIINDAQKLYAFIKDKVENYRLPDGSQFHWDIAPSADIINSTLNMSWVKTFKDDDVTLTANISGKPIAWVSNPGNTTFEQFDVNISFSATKRF